MRHRLIWVGRANGDRLTSDLCRRYSDRIKHFTSFEDKAIKPIAQDKDQIDREGERLLQQIPSHEWVILLDETGKQSSSQELAKYLHLRQIESRDVSWIIGGAFGVSQAVKDRANDVLSLSGMTLTHGFARILLLEQIYRAFCIRANHPYHHE